MKATKEKEIPTPLLEELPPLCWKVYVDGASGQGMRGAGILIVNPEGDEISYSLCFSFPSTNNVTEYEALSMGLRLAHALQAR